MGNYRRNPPALSQVDKPRRKRQARRDSTMKTMRRRLSQGRRAAMKGRSTAATKWTGPALLDLILSTGHSYAAMGEACGTSPATIMYWVHGRTEPSFSRAMRLAKYLRIDPWVLCTWLESRRREWKKARDRGEVRGKGPGWPQSRKT